MLPEPPDYSRLQQLCASGDYDVVLTQLRDRVDAELLAHARIKGISNYAVGVNNTAPELRAAKVARILTIFDRARSPLRITDIAERTGLFPSRTSRILKEFLDHVLVERRGHEYVLGLKIFELGAQVPCPQHLAQATLTGLHQATGHTVHLAVLEDQNVLYLETLPGPHCSPGIPQRPARRARAHHRNR